MKFSFQPRVLQGTGTKLSTCSLIIIIQANTSGQRGQTWSSLTVTFKSYRQLRYKSREEEVFFYYSSRRMLWKHVHDESSVRQFSKLAWYVTQQMLFSFLEVISTSLDGCGQARCQEEAPAILSLISTSLLTWFLILEWTRLSTTNKSSRGHWILHQPTPVWSIACKSYQDGLVGGEEELRKLVEPLNKACTAYSIKISAKKTKLMTNNTSGINIEIKVNGQKLETVTSFNYLGSVITD